MVAAVPEVEPLREVPARVERVEIEVTQPELSFGIAPQPRSASVSRSATAGGAPLLPVAALAERRRAGLLDAAFLLLAYGALLGLFGSLGGHFTIGKLDAAVSVAALALLYAQYFTLFTIFGGATPGMLLRRLRVVSFDRSAPSPRQLVWRSFGYLVSASTVLLGFLWALWDEDGLTWHDRISQTYLTCAEATIAGAESPSASLNAITHAFSDGPGLAPK